MMRVLAAVGIVLAAAALAAQAPPQNGVVRLDPGDGRVVGGAAHPFYRWVAATLGEAGAPRWNFCKYLVGPDGQLAGAWPSQVRPTDAAITGEIDKALAGA